MTYKEQQETIQALANAVVEIMTYEGNDETPDIYEITHEVVDGASVVIYTPEARAFIDSLDFSQIDEAEEAMAELGLQAETLWDYYSKLTYAYLSNVVLEKAEEEMEKLKEKGETE